MLVGGRDTVASLCRGVWVWDISLRLEVLPVAVLFVHSAWQPGIIVSLSPWHRPFIGPGLTPTPCLVYPGSSSLAMDVAPMTQQEYADVRMPLCG